MVLPAAEGLPNAEIGRRVGMTRQIVISWRERYEAGGIATPADLPRSGRPGSIDEAAVIASTLNPPPSESAVTHRSARLLAGQLSRAGMPVSFAEVARIWRAWGLQPHRIETNGASRSAGPDPRRGATPAVGQTSEITPHVRFLVGVPAVEEPVREVP